MLQGANRGANLGGEKNAALKIFHIFHAVCREPHIGREATFPVVCADS